MSASMATGAPPAAKGWCPGVLAPMQSGDGMLARVRPRGAALSALADRKSVV